MESEDAVDKVSEDGSEDLGVGYSSNISGLAGMLDFLGGAGVSGGISSDSMEPQSGGVGEQGKKRRRGDGASDRILKRDGERDSKSKAGAAAAKRATFRGAGGIVSSVPVAATSVFVHGIPFSWKTSEELIAVFSGLGDIVESHIALDSEGKGRGFGFVCFATEEAAGAAMAAQLEGRTWKAGGRKLHLEVCRKELVDRFHEPPKPPKPPVPIFGTSKDLRPRSVRAPAKHPAPPQQPSFPHPPTMG